MLRRNFVYVFAVRNNTVAIMMRAQRIQMMIPIRCSGRVVRIVLSVDWVRACAGCVIQSRKRGSDVGQKLMANCDDDSDGWLWFRVG